MKHLTPDEVIDAVEGTLDPALQRHLNACATCREEVVRLGEILLEAKAVDVPEPSPLFWNHFSTRVRAAIETEQTPQRHWVPVWLRWQVLAPIGALAVLLLALVSSVPRDPVTPSPVASNESAAPPVADDLALIGVDEWAVVSEIVGPVAIDEALDAGIAVSPGDADRIALQLNADEQRELVRLIKEEMNKSGD